MLTKRNLLALGAVLAPLGVWGCSSNSTPTPVGDGGSTSSSTATSSSGATSSDGGSSTSSSSSTGPCDAGAGTLYSRLGGHAGIRGAVDLVVAAELGDPDEATYFFWQAHPTAGHPSASQVEECFTDLLATAAQGPGESYPPDGGVFDDAGTVKTWQCRTDMVAIHTPLLISGDTFDHFIAVAAPVLTNAGVNACDLSTIATLLGTFKTQIVNPTVADAGLEKFPGDAGGD